MVKINKETLEIKSVQTKKPAIVENEIEAAATISVGSDFLMEEKDYGAKNVLSSADCSSKKNLDTEVKITGTEKSEPSGFEELAANFIPTNFAAKLLVPDKIMVGGKTSDGVLADGLARLSDTSTVSNDTKKDKTEKKKGCKRSRYKGHSDSELSKLDQLVTQLNKLTSLAQ